MNNHHSNAEFLNFGDQIRLHTTNFSNLSISDSIWSSNQPPDLGWKTNPVSSNHKLAFSSNNSSYANRNNNINDAVGNAKNKSGNDFGVKYSLNDYNGAEVKNYKDKMVTKGESNGFKGKKKNQNENKNDSAATVADKRFKSLPANEALPRNEAIGGYIFVCNNDTMEENLRRGLFGLPPRYRDSVRAITPGLPLFLYNYSTHQLHGIFMAASFGGTNIDPTAWEDKKCAGSSRFPAQVRVVTKKMCEPLEEDAFRPILHHYDGPKFRLELNVEEALRLLDIFDEKNA